MFYLHKTVSDQPPTSDEPDVTTPLREDQTPTVHLQLSPSLEPLVKHPSHVGLILLLTSLGSADCGSSTLNLPVVYIS